MNGASAGMLEPSNGALNALSVPTRGWVEGAWARHVDRLRDDQPSSACLAVQDGVVTLVNGEHEDQAWTERIDRDMQLERSDLSRNVSELTARPFRPPP